MQNLVLAFALMLVMVLIQSCSSQPTDTTVKTETPSSAPAPAAGTATSDTAAQTAASTDYIEIDAFRFKLAPDIQKDGVAHLDFYVRDKSDKHIKGVTGNFHVTKPDGSKIEIPIVEETPHDHYHGMVKLDQSGEYLIVAQVSVGGKKLNPRFSFSRKEQ